MASSNPNPNRSLSSAAAAAALRARPHTPTDVSEVQTKRTARRSPSVSSIGSVASAAARRSTQQPRMERRGSSGSMSERSFRSPSPHGERRPLEQDYPPVPAIPPGHRVSRSTGSTGIGMQTFKTASQKMETGLPSWYTQPQGDPSNVRTSDAPMRRGRPESITSVGKRPDSRSSSVNFSYPGRARAQSPPASPAADQNEHWGNPGRQAYSSGYQEQGLVYDPNSRRMVPKQNLASVSYQVKAASEKPVKSRKNQSTVQSSSNRLSKGTVARPRGTMVDVDDQLRDPPRREQAAETMQYVPRQETQVSADSDGDAYIPERNTVDRQSSSPYQARSPEPPEESRLSTPSPVPQDAERFASPRPGGKMNRKPSVVREEPEDDFGGGPASAPSTGVFDALDSVPTRQTLYGADDNQATPTMPPVVAIPSAETRNQGGVYQEPTAYATAAETSGYLRNKHVTGLARDDNSPKRSLSQSPARHARFAPGPSEGLVVRHAPLGRSISPIKSAMKHSSPSPRDVSPAGNSSDAGRAHMTTPERDAPAVRKKSARVSFDERSPVVVGDESHDASGVADSPAIPSPQTRRPWYSSIGRNKKKSEETALEDDVVMQPRPALPMFGSVREKKGREPDEVERPLIRPYEPSSTPLVDPVLAVADIYPVTGQSSDFAIGSAIAQDNASRNAANISRFREPLPPVVTSVDHVDLSDSVKSSDEEEGLFDTAADDSDEDGVPGTQTTTTTIPESQLASLNGSPIFEEKTAVESESSVAPAAPTLAPEPTPVLQLPVGGPTEAVPFIAVTQPSPGPGTEIKRQYFVVPGTFPEDDSEDGTFGQEMSQPPRAAPVPMLSSTAESMKEPEAVVAPSQATVLPQTVLATTPLQTAAELTDEDSNASVYSDAYEDASDMGDVDGYQSLNAVVESPITKLAHADRILEATVNKEAQPEEPEAVLQFPPATTSLALATAPETDWEQAKSFWRSLTTDKRRQLELEAMEDAGADGDQEEQRTPTRKLSNRAKKTAEQRLASSVVQAAHAQAMAPEEKQQQVKRSDADRTYMIQPGSKANHGPVSPTRPPTHMRMSVRESQPQPQPQPHTARSVAPTKNAPAEVHIRNSMRSGGSDNDSRRRVPASAERNTMMTTMRSRAAAPQDSRPSQHSRAPSNEVAASAAAAFARTNKPAKPMLQRRGSDASDSSFRRARAPPADNVSFRRSMRQEMAPASRPRSPPEVTKGSSRFSLRSPSPSGSAFRLSSTTAPPTSMGMRRSLRSGSDSSKESKRGSILFPSFGRTSGKTATKKPKSVSSRFGDSSDEDEPTSRFRSRFDDSSDEDDVRPSSSSRLGKGTLRGSAPASTNFKKVTTPVLEEEEGSPHLPDSDYEPSMQMPSPLRSPGNATSAFRPDMHQRSSSGIGTTTLRRTGSGRGTLAGSSTAPVVARPSHERRGSFMSNILRRNKKADSGSKVTRSDLMDSAARRDTNLERSTDELRNLRGDSRPTSPKLQKRSAFSRGDSWPLPETTENDRPNTSSGAVNGKRPDFAARRSTSLGIPGAHQQQPNGHDAGTETFTDGPDTPRKKKKFGALRRMFRLDE